MVDYRIHIGNREIRIRNFEIFTFLMLATLYIMAATIREGTWLYNRIADLSQNWRNMATNSDQLLLMAFGFATFGNTTVLIVFPYALIVFEIAKIYPNWIALALVSGAGAAVGEITSYLVGRLISKTKRVSESDLGEKFHRMRKRFEKKPGSVPFTVFLFALTPLPDDMILVPMGMMKYPYWKSVFPCFLGKTGLCMIMSWLGHVISINQDFLNQLAVTDGYSWLAPILRLFVPTEDINPAADLIQFSLIFIFVYIMVRMDFEKRAMRKSDLRKDFEKLLLEGGNLTMLELISRYNIHNEDTFRNFMDIFIQNHNNITKKGELVHFEEIAHKSQAKRQSLLFAQYLFDRLPVEYKKELQSYSKESDLGMPKES